jgi:hypothetical protein
MPRAFVVAKNTRQVSLERYTAHCTWALWNTLLSDKKNVAKVKVGAGRAAYKRRKIFTCPRQRRASADSIHGLQHCGNHGLLRTYE